MTIETIYTKDQFDFETGIFPVSPEKYELEAFDRADIRLQRLGTAEAFHLYLSQAAVAYAAHLLYEQEATMVHVLRS